MKIGIIIETEGSPKRFDEFVKELSDHIELDSDDINDNVLWVKVNHIFPILTPLYGSEENAHQFKSASDLDNESDK